MDWRPCGGCSVREERRPASCLRFLVRIFFMPFDPKIIRSDDGAVDPHTELHLPDDFSLLAEQLTDDANRLAACYPPREPEKLVMLSKKLSRGGGSVWLVRSLAGGSLAGGSL